MVKKSAMLHGAIQGANMVMKNIHDICSLKISANNQTSCIKEHKQTSMAIRLSKNRLAGEGGNLVTKKQVYKEDNGMLAKIQNAKPKVKCWSYKVQQKRDTKHQHMIK